MALKVIELLLNTKEPSRIEMLWMSLREVPLSYQKKERKKIPLRAVLIFFPFLSGVGRELAEG